MNCSDSDSVTFYRDIANGSLSGKAFFEWVCCDNVLRFIYATLS